MKKFIVALLCAIMLFSMFLPVMADDDGEDFEAEIGQISLPKGTPTIDGTVNADEGWSEAQPLNKENVDGGWGGEDVIIEGSLWRAYDEEYLYVAADIIIPELSISEGEDWIEGFHTTGNKPGWDGDVFIFTVDPLQSMLDAGFTSDCGVWYCFGIFEGNIVRAYRTHASEKEVSDILPSAGAVTDNGWRFEAAIPWETICEDIAEISYGDVELTPEDILQDGNRINAAMIYYDRRIDPEAGERVTYSRYVSICTTCPDGTPGVMATPWLIKSYGIYLMLEAGKEPAPEETTTAATGGTDTTATTTAASNDTTTAASETELVTDNKGNAVTDGSGNKVTQKVTKSTTKKAATGTTTGGNAAQTFDIGIAMAVGALAISGIGFAVTKKRR